MKVSGLSQRVVCNATPYTIRIVQRRTAPGWRVVAIDTTRRRTVWSGTAPDDASAFLLAMTSIHAHAARD